jgi:superfamily II DNA/RNA helicase
VLVATPGRLLDLFGRGKILLADVKILVIDESDRMLDMGFIPDVERIVGLLPRIRQTLFFSATMPPEIRRLADIFLTNPKEIAVSPPSTAAETVTQALVKVAGERKDKRAALRGLLRSEEVRSALIFCNRKRDVDILFRSLKRHKFSVAALHGDMAQPVRMETLQRFKDGGVELLVCSDVAARGLDLPAVSHVFCFDVPVHAEDYIHRIGRTGRAGRSGQAFTLALPEEARALAAVAQLLGHKIPEIGAEGEAAWSQAEVPERPGRRRRGRRKPEDRPRSKPASSKSAPRKAEAAQPVAAQPVVAKPVAVEPQIAEPEVVESRAPAPPRRAAHRATKAGATSAAKKPAGAAQPFGEHTPAFMLRPVNVA